MLAWGGCTVTELEIARLVIVGALELLELGKDWLAGKPPTPQRVEAVWASLEQVRAKMRTDALERERYGRSEDETRPVGRCGSASVSHPPCVNEPTGG